MSHNRATLGPDIAGHLRSMSVSAFSSERFPPMPSLFRFLITSGSMAAFFGVGLYILAHKFEPEQHEVVKVVPGVKIRKPDAAP